MNLNLRSDKDGRFKNKALNYHRQNRAGKIEVIASKPCQSAQELSLAYTPGVAEPVLEITDDQQSYEYTAVI